MSRIITKKRVILILFFLSVFITGTVLIFTVPLSVKSTYGLTTRTSDGVTISFNVFEPQESLYQKYNDNNNKKAIIIGHGNMANKEILKGYAIELANAGFVAVVFDFRGHGQSLGELDRGEIIDDVRAIKEYLNSRDDVDIHNLGYIGYSMGGFPGNQIISEDTDFKCFIGIGTGLPSEDYHPEYSIKANSNRSLNILMIQARYDEAVTVSRLKDGMALRLDMNPEDIDVNKLYGSFQDGNASMIFLDDNTNHLLLAWDQDFVREARNWVISTFPDVRQPDENFYVNIRFIILIFQLIGGIGLFFLIVDPLFDLILKIRKVDRDDEAILKLDLPDVSITNLALRTVAYSLILGLPGILIFIPLYFFPLFTAGNVLMLLCGQMFAILILLWRIGRKADTSLKGILIGPFKSRKNFINQILLGVILTPILYIIIYLSIGLNYFAIVPSLTKILFIPICFAICFFVFLVYSLLNQTVIQNKINNGFKGQIITGLITFGGQILYMIVYLLIFSFLLGSFFNFGVYLPITIPTTLLSSFVFVALYKKTGNIISSTFINAFIVTMITITVSVI
ncbi:MAG: alpha/beta fold hydrolase [Candidatus Lokiarchaeota archaeon]|nr:alpha/beta fold hydrolase [Candidatus Lokiarchaeota archaeon]